MSATTLGQLLREGVEEWERKRVSEAAKKADLEDNDGLDDYDTTPTPHELAVKSHRATMAQLKIHPWDRHRVDSVNTYTMVTCTSTMHGVEVYYLSMDEYSEHIKAIVDGSLWVNGYTFIIQPMGN